MTEIEPVLIVTMDALEPKNDNVQSIYKCSLSNRIRIFFFFFWFQLFLTIWGGSVVSIRILPTLTRIGTPLTVLFENAALTSLTI